MNADFDFFSYYLKTNKGRVFWYNLENKFVFRLPESLTITSNKIYIITENQKVLYVGVTTKNIRNRLRLGVKSNGKNGYHGYKWKNLEKIKINIFSFKEVNKYRIENLEAEIVFQIRLKTGKWPSYQNEIHFNNDFDNKQNANLILNKIGL